MAVVPYLVVSELLSDSLRAQPAPIAKSARSIRGKVELDAKAASNASASVAAGSVVLAHNNATAGRRYEPPKVGASKCIYYNQYEDSYISTVLAFEPTSTDEVQADPENVWGLPPRGDCWLALKTGAASPTDQDLYNWRIAELAVCQVTSKPSVCGSGKFCALDMRVPYPANADDRDNLASCIALAAWSKLQEQALHQDVGVVGGLTKEGDYHVVLSRYTDVPGVLKMKLDYAYNAFYDKVLIPSPDQSMYEETDYYTKKHDPLFLSREFEVVSCNDLSCLLAHAVA